VVFLQNLFRRTGNLIQRPQLIVLVAGVLFRLPLLFTPLSYNTDHWRQVDTASIAYHFYVNGYKLLYPQIFWGGNGPGYVETEFQLYPFLVAILYYFFGENYWLGKFVSLLFSIIAWLLFYQLAIKVLGKRRPAGWALFYLVFSPLYLRYSVAFMPEAAVMMFYIAALFFFVNWTKTSSSRHLILSSICSALAILVKPTSIHIGLIFALVALYQWRGKILRRWETWLSTAIALAPGVFWYWHARNIYLTYGNTFGLLSGGDSKFGSLGSLLWPHLYYHVPFLDWEWILGYGAIFLFLAGVVVSMKRRELRFIVFGIAIIGLYYLIVSRYAHEEWGIQYHVYMLPFAALAIGLGVEWMVGKYKGFARAGILWLSTGVFIVATLSVFYQMLTTGNDSLYECAGYVKEVVPSNERIIVSTASVAFENGIPNNYQQPHIFFYSKRYGWNLPADWHTSERLEGYRNLGAGYFVIYSKELFDNNPSLVDYLDHNSTQIGPGIDANCAIYRFSP
jgi:hypothetical protein